MPNKNLKDLETKLVELYEKLLPKKSEKKGPVVSKQTERYAKGSTVKSGRDRETTDEEAVVYVWHERDILIPTKIRTGHAAMKLNRYSEKYDKNLLVRYISWWPGAGAGKDTKAQPGQRSESTRDDRSSEMSQDWYLKTLLKLQFLRIATLMKDGTNDPNFDDIAQNLWMRINVKRREEFKKRFNVADSFSNLADLNVKTREDQKLVYIPSLDKDGNKVLPFLEHVDLQGLSIFFLANSKGILAFKNMTVVKQPYAKVYVPCSCVPERLYPLNLYRRRCPWGLSIDAMDLRFRCYEEGFRSYKMQSFSDNCIGAVWECLKSGLSEALTDDFKPSKTFESNLAHFKSLIPSDVINASKALADEIERLNKQQTYLDLRALEHKEPLAQLALENMCFEGSWRDYLCQPKKWREFSSAPGLRPTALRPIDALVDKYANNERLLGRSDKNDIQDLLKLEAVWETRCDCTKGFKQIKSARVDVYNDVQVIDNAFSNILRRQGQTGRGFGSFSPDDLNTLNDLRDEQALRNKRLEELDKQWQSIEKQAPSALKAWEQELERNEKIRQSRAKILVDLHEAVFKYVFKQGVSPEKPDRRYFAVLLLGQFACWLFAEVAHDNLAVRFHGFTEGGVSFSTDEKEKRLGDAYPHLRVNKRYSTDNTLTKDLKEDYKKRDYIIL